MVLHRSLEDVLADCQAAKIIAIDIPLGHEDPAGTADEGRRRCDREARAFVGAQRQASVFWVPPPSAFQAETHAEAVELCRSRGWIAPSAQLWALKARILNAGRLSDERFFEVHPEASFQTLLRESKKGDRLAHSKATWSGLVERLELLHHARLRPERSLGGVGRASPDDVLDATIAAWTAWRLHEGRARPIPEIPPKDPTTNRPVAIWV
jgi:predicted RNase H-like nuclease